MTFQDFAKFPFIDFGILLVLIAAAIQILRGKLGAGMLEFIKANKSLFDENDDQLIIALGQRFHRKPEQVRKTIEMLYLWTVGEPLAPEIKAKLEEKIETQTLESNSNLPKLGTSEDGVSIPAG